MHALLIALAACCLGQTRADKAIYPYRGTERSIEVATLHTWTNGDADGDWNAVGNWSSGAVPDGNDHYVFFDGDLTQTGPSVNLDRSDAQDAVARLITKPNFTGDVGGPGNPLVLTVYSGTKTNARCIHRGTGDVYLTTYPDAGAADLDVVMDGHGVLHLDTEAGAPYSPLRHVFCKRGTINIASTCFFGDTIGNGAEMVAAGPAAVINIAAADSTQVGPYLMILWGGTINNARLTTAGDLLLGYVGTLNQTGEIVDTSIVVFGSGARLNYATLSTLDAGSNPDVLVDGTLDCSAVRQEIAFNMFVRGERANILGNPAALPAILGNDVDLREEYP